MKQSGRSFDIIGTGIDSVKVIFGINIRESIRFNEFANISGAKTTSRQDAIISIIEQNQEITLDAMAKEIGLGTTTLDRKIAKMAHLIRRVGAQKGWHWEN